MIACASSRLSWSTVPRKVESSPSPINDSHCGTVGRGAKSQPLLAVDPDAGHRFFDGMDDSDDRLVGVACN